ncbi:MAG: MFS transporter, partial [Candidatus Woesearchaeota archaeon]
SGLGWLYGLVLFAFAIGNLASPWLYKRMNTGLQLLAVSIAVGTSLMLLALGKSPLSIGWLVITAFAAGISNVATITTINRILPSDKRATVISISATIAYLAVGLASIASGPLIAASSLRAFTAGAAIVSFMGCSIFALLLMKETKTVKK